MKLEDILGGFPHKYNEKTGGGRSNDELLEEPVGVLGELLEKSQGLNPSGNHSGNHLGNALLKAKVVGKVDQELVDPIPALKAIEPETNKGTKRRRGATDGASRST